MFTNNATTTFPTGDDPTGTTFTSPGSGMLVQPLQKDYTGEYDNIKNSHQIERSGFTQSTAADPGQPPPLPSRSTKYKSSLVIPLSEQGQSTPAQVEPAAGPLLMTQHAQAELLQIEQAQINAPVSQLQRGPPQSYSNTVLQASGSGAFHDIPRHFQDQQHCGDSQAKTAAQVYLERQRQISHLAVDPQTSTGTSPFISTNMNTCPHVLPNNRYPPNDFTNSEFKDEHINQCGVHRFNTGNHHVTHEATGHKSTCGVAHKLVETDAGRPLIHVPPLRFESYQDTNILNQDPLCSENRNFLSPSTAEGWHQHGTPDRMTHKPAFYQNVEHQQHVSTFEHCSGQVGATMTPDSLPADTNQADIHTYDSSFYQYIEDLPLPPFPPAEPKPPGAQVRRASGHRLNTPDGVTMCTADQITGKMNEHADYRRQSVQEQTVLSSDHPEQLRSSFEHEPVYTEPLYDIIGDEDVSCMVTTEKAATERENESAAVMLTPSAADKKRLTLQSDVWECRCGNVNLVRDACLSCKKTKQQQEKEDENLSNIYTQEPETTEPSPEEWQCQHCTYFNPIDERICEACAKTRGIAFEEAEQENLEDDHENNSLEDTEKKCPECDFVNLAEAELCISCACELPRANGIPLKEPLENHEHVDPTGKHCPFCTYDNKYDAKICEMCHKTFVKTPKPEQAGEAAHQYKLCVDCGRQNKPSTTVCQYCKCGNYIPEKVPIEHEQENDATDKSEKKPGFLQRVKKWFPTVWHNKDKWHCPYCAKDSSGEKNTCGVCGRRIQGTPVDSRRVIINEADFDKWIKVGHENGFDPPEVMWALGQCGVEGPIQWLLRMRETNRQRESSMKAAQNAVSQRQYQSDRAQYDQGTDPIFCNVDVHQAHIWETSV